MALYNTEKSGRTKVHLPPHLHISKSAEPNYHWTPPRGRHSRPTWQQCSSRERFRTGNDISSKLAGPGGRAEVVVRCCIASFPPQISLDNTSYPRGEQSTLTRHGLRTLLWLCFEQRRSGSGSRGSSCCVAGEGPCLPEEDFPIDLCLLSRGPWRCSREEAWRFKGLQFSR